MIVHGTCDLDKKEQDRLYMCDVPILKSNYFVHVLGFLRVTSLISIRQIEI